MSNVFDFSEISSDFYIKYIVTIGRFVLDHKTKQLYVIQ